MIVKTEVLQHGLEVVAEFPQLCSKSVLISGGIVEEERLALKSFFGLVRRSRAMNAEQTFFFFSPILFDPAVKSRRISWAIKDNPFGRFRRGLVKGNVEEISTGL